LGLYLKRWRKYPLAFAIEAFQGHKYGYPTHQQAQVYNALPENDFIIIKSGHGIGKSRILAVAGYWHLFCNRDPGIPLKIPVTGPTSGNIDDVLWSEFSILKGQLLPWLSDRLVMNQDGISVIESRADWFISPRTARKDNPNAMQGFHGKPMFLIDEAPEIDEKIFEVIQGARTDEGARSIMAGNPTRLSGYFHKIYHEDKQEVWKRFHFSCLDTLSSKVYRYPFFHPDGTCEIIEVRGRVTDTYIKNMKIEYGENSPVYACRVLGDFPIDEKDQVIRRKWADDSLSPDRIHTAELSAKESAGVMGVDVAWTGVDDSSYVIRFGNEIREVEAWHGNDPTETAKIVGDRWDELKKNNREPAWIAVDAIGIGAGVYSNLRAAGYPVIPVNVAEIAPSYTGTPCSRLRDWLWWQCRNLFRDGTPYFVDRNTFVDRLVAELANPSFILKNGKILIESKPDMKKRGLKSPDLADALCLTFAVEARLHTPPEKRNMGREHHKKKKNLFNEPQSWKYA